MVRHIFEVHHIGDERSIRNRDVSRSKNKATKFPKTLRFVNANSAAIISSVSKTVQN